MNMNVIKNLKCNAKAKISYEVPKSGDFVALWEFGGVPYSATYRWKNNELLVCDDFGIFYQPGYDRVADYLDLSGLVDMVSGYTECQLIAFVSIDVEAA